MLARATVRVAMLYKSTLARVTVSVAMLARATVSVAMLYRSNTCPCHSECGYAI